MALKFRRGTTAQKSGSLAFGEPYVNTTLGTLQIGLDTGDVTLASSNGLISGSSQLTSSYDERYETQGRGIISSSAQIDLLFDIDGLVSGSSQITLQSTTGFTTYDSALSTITGSLISSASANTISINNLNSFSGSQLTQNASLATISGSLISSASTAKTTNDSQDTSIANLNSYTSSLQAGIQMTGSTVSFLGNIIVYGTQSVINSQNVSISDNILYLSPTASIDNDLGIVGHYNDGTYRHAGIFMDASDGHTWKVFNGLTDETSAQVDVNGNGFTLADFKAGAITGTSFNGTINATNGVVSGSSQLIGILGSLNTYTGSNDTTNTTQNTRLTALEASASTALSTNNTQDTSITNINSFTSSINTTIKNKLNTETVISGSSQVQLGSASGNIALATQTTGDYVASLVAGTGVTITNNSGENATPTIAIGQAVATTSTPTFGNLTINGTITATGDITAYYTSDKRHKNNIQTIPNALEKVSKLNGVTWEWNEDVNEVTKSTPKTGLIAQEVQEVLPEVVVERENGFLGLDYSKMMGLMVEAIKEQQTQIHNLTLQIEELKKQKGL
jgi:hypothetical protein